MGLENSTGRRICKKNAGAVITATGQSQAQSRNLITSHLQRVRALLSNSCRALLLVHDMMTSILRFSRSTPRAVTGAASSTRWLNSCSVATSLRFTS